MLEKVPEMTLPAYVNDKIENVSIKSMVKEYLVLVFYPYNFTIVCPTEVNEFSNKHDDFAKLGANLAFVSCDSVYSHRAWARFKREEGGIGGVCWPMLSDYKKELSSSLLLLSEDGSCRRGTVIIDKDMKIRHYSFNDRNIGRSVSEVRRLLNAVGFYDKKGEMCAVNWNAPS